jgi:hypothetical protein
MVQVRRRMDGLERLANLCRRVEAQVPPEVLAQHKAYKKSLDDPPLIKDGYFLVTAEVEQALEAKYGRSWHIRFPDWDRDQDDRYWLALKHYRPGPSPETTAR